MAKFKNKLTGKIIEENLLYYVNKFKNDSNYIEIKNGLKFTKEKTENKKKIKEEVENISR